MKTNHPGWGIEFPGCRQSPEDSHGRAHPEKEHRFRNCYQRDRERIIHSTSFRKLDGKTQVFLSGTGDYYRTRLTHTMEVASIARALSRSLGVCEDLAEAIALAHDLGHPPFGHSGEVTLNLLLKDAGGFDHNEQSLRVVELLEESYPQHHGLNLSHEVLEGLKKHHGTFSLPDGNVHPSPSLEAQIANLADEVAYYTHDLEDGLESGILDESNLSSLPLWSAACRQAEEESGAYWKTCSDHSRRKYILRCMVNIEFVDIIASTRLNIIESGVMSAQDVRLHPSRLVGYSPQMKKMNSALRSFLYENFYGHPRVVAANKDACQKLETVFRFFEDHPEQMGSRTFAMLPLQGLKRTVADYIAGMTDKYLLNQTCLRS